MRHAIRIAAAPVALWLAACAVPGPGDARFAEFAGGREGPRAAAAPFACALDVTRTGRQVDVAATVTGIAATSGTYALRLGQSGGGGTASVDQGGPFRVAAGERVVLGQVSLPARPALDGSLAVTWAGGTVACPVTGG